MSVWSYSHQHAINVTLLSTQTRARFQDMDGQDAAWMTRKHWELDWAKGHAHIPTWCIQPWSEVINAKRRSCVQCLWGAEVVGVLLWFYGSMASTWFIKEFPKWHLLIHTDPIGPTIVLWPLGCIKSACLIFHDHNTVGVFTKEGCSPQFLDVSSSDAWWRVSYSSYQMLVHYLCVWMCVMCVCV